MVDEEDYGPLFEGTEQDLYRLAFENVTMVAKESERASIKMGCENCGVMSGALEECNICLFFWCDKCFDTPDHLETHRVSAKYGVFEERL